MAHAAEVSPLLGNASGESYSSVYPTAPSREDSPPPSYDDVSFMPTRVKACDVCNYQIDIVKHPNDYVVKCPRCSEVTNLGQCIMVQPIPRNMHPYYHMDAEKLEYRGCSD
ncbi:hypothetical protein MRX96_031002 [Rhipicephalus microplus]